MAKTKPTVRSKNILSNNLFPRKGKKQPLWKGPLIDGITFSMLSRFIVCRERFRLYALEGLQTFKTFNHRIEYGNMWHACEEALAVDGKDWKVDLKTYCQGLAQRYPIQQDQVDKWYNVCLTQFPVYAEYWSEHVDERGKQSIAKELVFDIPYQLDSGRIIRLRGKFDALDVIGKGDKAELWLQENKTKGDINEQQLVRQLTFDLQTMMYLTALSVWLEGEMLRDLDVDHLPRLRGVRYNVIRRPLSGGRGSIVQHKPTKSKPLGESKQEYYERLGGIIAAEPEYFFMRWKVPVTKSDIGRFRRECLDPLLESLCDWYEWIVPQWQEPFGNRRAAVNALHWRHPYGVFNILDEGGSSDVDEYMQTGNEAGLERVDKLFSELR